MIRRCPLLSALILVLIASSLTADEGEGSRSVSLIKLSHPSGAYSDNIDLHLKAAAKGFRVYYAFVTPETEATRQ